MQTVPEQKPNHIFYRDVLDILRQAEIPFLISGGFALQQFTGILRQVRDLDIFVLEKHIHAALEALAQSGILLGAPAGEDWEPRRNSRHLGARHDAGPRALR